MNHIVSWLITSQDLSCSDFDIRVSMQEDDCSKGDHCFSVQKLFTSLVEKNV